MGGLLNDDVEELAFGLSVAYLCYTQVGVALATQWSKSYILDSLRVDQIGTVRFVASSGRLF